MGFRVNKRIKICKGLSLNVGKKGISTSVKLGNVSVNSRGRVSASIPGTGISYSTKLKSGRKQTSRRRTNTVTVMRISQSEYMKLKGKNATTTFVLAFLFGCFGGHYFYLGQNKKAVLYLLTAGLCGIGWMYDIFGFFVIMLKNIPNKKENITSEEMKAERTVTSTPKSYEFDIEHSTSGVEKLETTLEQVDRVLNRDYVKSPNLYLNKFDNVKMYDVNETLGYQMIEKMKRNTEIEYELFMKQPGTTKQPMDFIVFDLETTGLSEQNSEIIEIGAIKFSVNKPTEVFHTYIKPTKQITAKITSINGITNSMVKDAPTIEEVLPKFLYFIGDEVLVAHNSSFDMKFILHQLYKNGYKKPKNKVIDTLKLSRKKVRAYDVCEETYKKLENYKLATLKEKFELCDLGSHNAIDDCKVCAYVYLRIIGEREEYCCVDYI